MVEKKDNDTKRIGDSWDELEIEIPNSKIGSSQDIKIRVCPACKDKGKRKDNDSSLSVNPAKGVGRCHKCSTVFIIRNKQMAERVDKSKKAFTPPKTDNLTKVSAAAVQYFTNRRISQASINAFKISEGKHGFIAFPYYFNGELVNIKYKNIKEKKYMQSPGGLHVMFNYDEAVKHNTVIICEGEEEVMCWYDAGYPNAVSVDSGAPNPNDKIERKLECLDNCIDLFENADAIFIAVDNDPNGRRLEQELIRRFAIEKVKTISFAPHKDANEYLMYEGRDKLKELFKTAKDVPMDGVFYASDVEDKLWDMYKNGLPKGSTTYMPSIDKHWKWRQGEITIGTGYNNEGKSTMMDINLPVLKAHFEGWKTALYVPENFPAEEFYEEVIHTYIGTTTDVDLPDFRMSERDFAKGIEFCKKHFFLVYPEKDATVERIFERFDYLVRKEGIRIAVIDPYNQIEHLFQRGETIDMYVSRFMGLLTRFTITRRLCTVLIVHQNPPEKRAANGKDYPEPDIYKIKNGGTFADKTFNAVWVWRPTRNTDEKNPLTIFGSRKIKKKKLVGMPGDCELLYDWKSNRYLDPLLGDRNGNPRSPLDVPIEELRRRLEVEVDIKLPQFVTQQYEEDEQINLPF